MERANNERARVGRFLIALSGIDGAGKSTQTEFLQGHLGRRGAAPVCLWTRGGYTSGINALKGVARWLAGPKLPAAGPGHRRDRLLRKGWIQSLWLAIAILDLIRVYGVQVRWWLLRGRLVLCDRYLWDTLIDFRLMFPQVNVERWVLWKALVRLAPQPDIAFLLTIPLVESEKRCQIKYEPFPDTPERREQRHALYQEYAKLKRWSIVDASRPAAAVSAEIAAALQPHLG